MDTAIGRQPRLFELPKAGRISDTIRLPLLAFAVIITLATILLDITGVNPRNFYSIMFDYWEVAAITALIPVAIDRTVRLFQGRPVTSDWRFSCLLTSGLVAGSMLPLFGLFKQLILPMRGFPFDAPLAHFERALLGGHDAWQLTHALLPSLGAALVLDRAYSGWLGLMFVFPFVSVVAFDSRNIRTRLLTCWLFAWVVIGGAMAWLMGSAGPVYYNKLVGPDAALASLNVRLDMLGASAHAQGTAINAIDFQSLLLGAYQARGYAAAGGISAMPSMHVAMATLFMLAGFKHSRLVGTVFAIYLLLIWIGSVHLGWHYALDGVVGAAVMGLIWKASGRFYKSV